MSGPMQTGPNFGMDEDGDPDGPTNGQIEEERMDEMIENYYEANPDGDHTKEDDLSYYEDKSFWDKDEDKK